MDLKKSNLLVVSDRYPHIKDAISLTFVKCQVDCLKSYFNKIYVISLTPYVPKYLSNSPFMDPRWARDAFACDYEDDNVSVYFAKHLALPLDILRKKRGDIAFKTVNKIIKSKKLKFDLIHSHFIYPSGYVGSKLNIIYNKPLIITGHGHDVYYLPFKDLEWGKKIKNILSVSDRIITPSKSNYSQLMRLGIPASKVSIIPNGYDPTKFKNLSMYDARKKLQLPIDKKLILSVGNLEAVKGHRYLVKAIDALAKESKNVLCIIVGAGSQEKNLSNLINLLDVYNYIKLVGGVSHQEIPLWMNACDVFVLPSLRESFGIVQVEAMACGKPIVATRNGGSEEIIINDKLGILVEPKDPEALALAILQALEAEWDAEYIREHAQQFMWEKMVERIVEVYGEVFKEH